MRKLIKIVLIIVVTIVLLVVLCLVGLTAMENYKLTHYYENATPAGEIEKKYTAMGPMEVSYAEFGAENELWMKYEVWYPSVMIESRNTYPLVVMANGTGVKASQYKEVFKHLASWGFIVIGNEDENSRTGASSAATLDFILGLNSDPASDFYCKVDIDHIGIAGHSQGGVGAINAVTNQSNGDSYKAIFVASTTSNFWSQDHVLGPEWKYDMTKVHIPCFMVAGTGAWDAGTAKDITATEGQGICPLWDMTNNYNAIPETVSKVMAREVGKDHGDMLRYADGYMTAWFMYWLKGDVEAGTAFFGEGAEILSNQNWQDIKIAP